MSATGLQRQKKVTLTGTGQSGAFYVGDLENVRIQASGTFSSDSIQPQLSDNEGQVAAISDWEDEGSPVTAEGFTSITGRGTWLRYDKTAGSAAILLVLTGDIRIR